MKFKIKTINTRKFLALFGEIMDDNHTEVPSIPVTAMDEEPGFSIVELPDNVTGSLKPEQLEELKNSAVRYWD